MFVNAVLRKERISFFLSKCQMTEGKMLATHRKAQEVNVPVYRPAGHILSCPEQLLEIATLHILDCI
jgi:hypothetical protein